LDATSRARRHARVLPRRSGEAPGRAGAARGRRRRRAVALLAALALAGSAAACGDRTEAARDEPPPTFSRAEGAALRFDEPVSTVTDLLAPTGEGEPWTIVGSVFDPDRAVSRAAVWTSDDARDWEPELVSDRTSTRSESLAAVVATGEGLLAVGQVGDGEEADAAVWRRTDDGWERSLPEVMGGEHGQWAFAVTAGEGGILVAGGENVWGEIRPRLWLSRDGGETWESVDGGPGGPLDRTGEESVTGIAALGEGFVAVGTRTVESNQDGVAWWSPDGREWEEVEAPTLGGPGRQALNTVAVTPDGIVVAGGFASDQNGQGQPTIWRSADGRTWGDPSTPLEVNDRLSTARDLAVRSVTSAPQGLIAAGGNESRPALWHSTDAGASWSALPNPVHGHMFQDGVALRDAEGDGSMTVAIGAEPTVLLLAGARWEDATGDAFPTGGDRPFGTSVAVGDDVLVAGGTFTAATGETREKLAGRVWRRTSDGWQVVETEHLAAGHIRDVVAFAGGYAAVGIEDFGVADQRNTITDPWPDGLVWVSENGEDWARIGVENARIDEAYLEFLDNPSPEQAGVITALELEAPPKSAAPAGGDGTQALDAVAPFQQGFVAVGSSYHAGDADPIIVVSPDGRSYVGEEPPHRGPGNQTYNDVCVGPGGTVVAVGAGGPNGGADVLIAARIEGEGWVAAEGPFAAEGDQQAYACAGGEDGFIAVGYDDSTGNIDARVWVSEDGRRWEEVASSLLGGVGDQWATAAAPVPGGGWLVGGTDASTDEGDVALWLLGPDGEISRRDRGEPSLSGPGRQSVSDIAIAEDGRVTIVGDDHGRVGIWESETLER